MKRKKVKEDSPEKDAKPRKLVKSSVKQLNNLDGDTKVLVADVKQLLKNETTLLTGLSKLRDALRNEEDGFEIFKEFVKDNSECPEIYKTLEKGKQNQNPLELQIAMEVLEQLLLLTASNTTYAAIGMVHVRRLLQNHLKLLYSCLNPSGHHNMIKGALKLLVAMVAQGAFAAREVVAVFDLTLKAFGGLVNKRDSKKHDNIRTCLMKFIMSFLMFGDDSTIRHVLDIKGFVSSIFKLVTSDPPHIITMVIQTLHEKVVKNTQVPKKTKVQLFSSYVLSQLSRLYKYSPKEDDEEDDDEREMVREKVHELMQDVCCTFKYGICFANKLGMFSWRSNNPVLLRFLQSVPKTDHDPLLQELIIKILTCCPDLVQPYITSLKITYEPRLSLPWITNINFIIKIYSTLSLPSVMIGKAGVELREDSVLQSALNTVFPSVLTRLVLNQGIQHLSLMVKNKTLGVIKLVLDRAADLLMHFNNSISTITEDSFTQQFTDNLIKVLPDVKTIISLRQNLLASKELDEQSMDLDEDDNNNDDILSGNFHPKIVMEKAVQVLYGYQRVEPLVLSSLAFDLGKLLPGSNDLSKKVFSSTVLHYTLKILLELPRGTFKWYQKKSKLGPSCMYNILHILVNSSSSEVKTTAKSLICKLLLDEGIIDDNSHEIQTWLKHLHNKTLMADQESLVLFLDSVMYSVAMEPYTYTDIVMEMTSQARQANNRLSLHESIGHARVTFSPLVVRAVMSHVETVSSSREDCNGKHLVAVAQYINLVVLDFLRVMVDPLPLMLTVERFYGDIKLPKQLSWLRNTHGSLLQYVCRWMGTPLEVCEDEDEKRLTKMFLKALKNDPSNENLAALLCRFSETQFRDAVSPSLSLFPSCVTLLANHVTIMAHYLIGSLQEPCLVKELPFPTLLWQVLGPLIINSSDSNAFSIEDINSSTIEAILIDSLQRDDTLSYPGICNHLLHYLSVFLTSDRDCVTRNVTSNGGGVTSGNNSVGLNRAAFTLVFTLLEIMIERLSHATKPSRNPADADVQDEKHPCVTRDDGLLTDFCEAFLGHPVLHKCFVTNVDDNGQGVMIPELTAILTRFVKRVVDNADVDVTLIQPYIDVICNDAVMEITRELHDKGSPLQRQSLQLLKAFSAYCDEQNRSKVVTSLLELPLNKLVHNKKARNTKKSTQFYETLLALLNSYHVTSHVTSMTNQDPLNDGKDNTILPTNHNGKFTPYHVNLRTNEGSFELLSVRNFQRLLELSMTLSAPELDEVVHLFIKTSPSLLHNVKSAYLDCCLDNVNTERISMATTMISGSVSLLKHFERRCCTKDKSVSPLKLVDLNGFLPVIKCYLTYASRIGGSLKDNQALKFILNKYWSHLWKWLMEPKHSNSDCEDDSSSVLKLIIRLRKGDTQSLEKKLEPLLNMVPEQIWDHQQISILHTILNVLTKNDGNYELVWKSLCVCMENVSAALTTDSDDNSVVEKTLELIHDVITLNKGYLTSGSQKAKIEADVWVSFVKSCLKYNFDSLMAFKCMSVCVKPLYSTHSKSITKKLPLTMMYELVLTHSKFLEVIMGNEKTNANYKEAILEFVVAIAEMSPDCCQQTHLPVFFAAYTASLSQCDQLLLYLLHLYEKAQVSLSTIRPYLWGKAALEQFKIRKLQGPSLWQQPSTNEVLELLDESLMNRSANEFSLDRKLKPDVQHVVDSSLYDPCFIVPLFCHLLAPNSEVDCRKFVERGGLGYTVAALSSRDEHMRKAASHVMSRYLVHLEATSFREKKQIFLLLDTFRNGISEVNSRVSSVITRFISRAANVMLRPEHQMYVILNSFLLQRAVMDLREVPLFYTLFNSSSLQYRNERMWILELLKEGLRDAQDYYVHKKRHVMELVMGFHDSQLSDQQSRKLVIGLLHSSLAIHAAAFDLAKNYGIVGWIHGLCLRGGIQNISNSLSLLHKLWFTIQHGKPSVSDGVVSGEETLVPVPPNLAQETLLVCKTFIRFLSSHEFKIEDIGFLFELLNSVLTYLGKELPQGSHLMLDDILRLITQWCKVFNEQQALFKLMDEVHLTMERKENDIQLRKDDDILEHKQKSLNNLIDVITLTKIAQTTIADSSSPVYLLACSFALEFSPVEDDITPGSHLHNVVSWIRQCLVGSPSLQKTVVGPNGEQLCRRLLHLYSFVDVSTMHEVNYVFLLLISLIQHNDHDVLGSSANKIAERLSQGVYYEMMSLGLVQSLCPSYTSLLGNDCTENAKVEVFSTELMSAFLRDLWFGQPVPSHFLEILVESRHDIASKIVSILNDGSAELQKLILCS